jgi:hypothetical protein
MPILIQSKAIKFLGEITMKTITLLPILVCIISITASCNTLTTKSGSEAVRLITIDGKSYKENEYTSWRCYKNLLSTKVLVEVGRFSAQELHMNGFILFDGGNIGELISYKRAGLNHRWDWDKVGDNYKYTFVIEPEGNGLYYDFSGTKNESSQKAKATYKCKTNAI